jgi:hypothetical protein
MPRLDRELARLDDLFTHPLDECHFDADLAWAEPLDADEREEMRRELGAALVTAMLTGQWAAYDEALDAWRATAEVLRDPELTARLMAEGDPSEEVPLQRP